MSTISPARLTAAMSAAMQVRESLGTDEDNALLLGMIEGETEALTLMDRLAEVAIADAKMAEAAAARGRRFKKRAEAGRDTIKRMLIALEIMAPLERALYTASLTYRADALVTDADAIPPEFARTGVDMVKLTKALRAGEDIPGATLSNEEPYLTIRTT